MALEDWFGKNGGMIPVTIEDGDQKVRRRLMIGSILKFTNKASLEHVQ